MRRIEKTVLDPNVATSVLPPGLIDFSVATAEKLRSAVTDRNGRITNTVFAVCRRIARSSSAILKVCRSPAVPLRHRQTVLEVRAEMRWPSMVEIGTRSNTSGGFRTLWRRLS
jgi:hypothetical protein